MAFTEEELVEFKTDALELLDVAEKSLLALDLGAEFKNHFDAIFRCFHNLKGASGMMELNKLQTHTHNLENKLMELKNDIKISSDHINYFLRGIDLARLLLDGQGVLVEEAAVINSSFSEFINECDEIIDRVSEALQIIESQNYEKEHLNSLYRDIHSLKGAAYLMTFNLIGDLAHTMESSLEGLRELTFLPSKDLLNCLYKCIRLIESEILLLKNNTKNESNEEKFRQLIAELSVAVSGLRPALAPILEPVAEKEKTQVMKKNEDTASVKEQESVNKKSAPPAVEEQMSQIKTGEGDANGSIRVPVSLLDNLMTLMGEMVLVRNQVLQFSSKSEDLEFLNLSKRLNMVTSEIQGEMMKTRMQPIGNVLTKFNRVVRELSIDLKKEINLTLSGADTELDKSLLEAVKDPLTHIVRNSCDHGIESPEIRTQAGKDRMGKITIRSFHEGGQVVIEIKDDGKGLERETLIRKGIEKGLITHSQAAGMSEKEVFNLIFSPGFSTAASVTNVSGRGVGMDVVRTNIEKIGGSVELNSVSGKGTDIKLKIPLTLAIVPALIIRCGGETFAIPQVKLEELVRVEPGASENKIEYLHGAPVYRLRGNILPLVNLNKILGLPEKKDLNSVSNIAILNADQCSFGLIVDAVQDTADIVVKPINRLLKSLQVYSGATILGDGSIALILDVMGISKLAQIGNEAISDELSLNRNKEQKDSEQQDFLIVRLHSPSKHAIVLGYVHRLEEFKASLVEHTGSQRVIRYGKSILHLISVSEQLGYITRSQSVTKDNTISVVVIERSGVLYGFEVEDIVDTFSTDADVDTTLVNQVGIFGNINTDDELIVTIDPFEIINKAFPENILKSGNMPADGEIKSTKKLRPAAATSKFAAKELTASSFNILLAEDTVFFRRAVTKILTKAGYEVSVAVDGKEALGILERNPSKFSLLISDIEMPGLNGFELAEAVRKNPQLEDLPMLALSSRVDDRYTEQGIRSGFNIYMEKLKADELLEAIEQLTLAKRRVG